MRGKLWLLKDTLDYSKVSFFINGTSLNDCILFVVGGGDSQIRYGYAKNYILRLNGKQGDNFYCLTFF